MGKAHSLTAMAMSIQAKCYCNLRKYAEAKSLQWEAITVSQTALGSRHLLTLRLRHEYAKILFEAEEYEAAEQAMIEVLEDEKRYLREDHPHTIESAKYLDEISAKLGKGSVPVNVRDIDEENGKLMIVQTLLKTFEEAGAVLGSDHPENLVLKRELALAQESAGQKDDAISLVQEVLERQNEVHTATHPETITTLMELMRLKGEKENLQQTQLSRALIAMIRDKSTKDLELFRRIVEYCPGMSAKDPETGYTALALAVHNNEVNLVRCLLEAGTDANSVESDGKTCLHISVAAQLAEIVRLLLANKADPNVLDTKDGRSPLYLASTSGNFDIARILLEGSADPNFTEDVPALHVAAGYNRLKMVQLLLDHGANIEGLSSEGLTPFLNSIFHSHLPMVKLLHKRGANAGSESRDGIKALHLACFKGSKAIVTFLIRIGQDVQEAAMPGGFTPLHIAAEQGFWEIMEVLMQAGASLDLQTVNANAQTPLVHAVFGGRADVVERILKVPGQTPNEHLGPLRTTLMHFAAAAGHVNVIEKLLMAGADINALASTGATALIEAVREGRLAAVEKLLAAGAKVDIVSQGKTALQMSLFNRKTDILEAIIKHPAVDVNTFIFGRITLLYIAMYFLPSSTVHLLLKRGANPNIPSTPCTGGRQYPLQFAVELQERTYIQALLNHGADQSLQDHFGRTAIDTVGEGDDSFCMLSTNFLTSRSDHIAKAREVIANFSLEVSELLASGKPKTDHLVKDKLEIMAQAFLAILHNPGNARICLEQCINLEENGDGKRVMENVLSCNMCRPLNGIVGTMYVCTKCPATALCEKCFEGQKNRTTSEEEEEQQQRSMKVCRHGVEMYFSVPMDDGWAELDKEGFVHRRNEGGEGKGKGVMLKEWLEAKAIF